MSAVAQRACARMNFNGHQSSPLSLCGEARLDLKGTDVPYYATFTELMFPASSFYSPSLLRREKSIPYCHCCCGNRPFVMSSREQPSLLGLIAGVVACHWSVMPTKTFFPSCLNTKQNRKMWRPHQNYNKRTVERCKHQAKYTALDVCARCLYFFPNVEVLTSHVQF